MMDLVGTAVQADEREMLGHPLVGGVILFSRNYRALQQLTSLTADIRRLRPDILIAVDYEGGRVQRFRDGFTALPAMGQIGRLHDRAPQLALQAAHAVGWLIGTELGAADIDLPLAPVLDLDHGISAVIGDRAIHRDPAAVSALANALCRGLRSAGMAATGKHYPGHGAVAADSHERLPMDERDLPALEADAAPFAQLIAGGLESVMMAHVRYPAVDNLPASLSAKWIGERLRKGLGFDGAVLCDDLSMGGAAVVGDYPDRALAALAAGCDILPLCNNPAAVGSCLDSLPRLPDRAAQRRRAALRRRPACTAGRDERAAALRCLADAMNTPVER